MSRSSSSPAQRVPAGPIRYLPQCAARFAGGLLALVAALAAVGCQQATTTASDTREHALLMLDGEKIGHLVVARTVSEDRVVTAGYSTMAMRRGSALVTMEQSGEEVETLDGRAISFHSVDKANGQTVQEIWGTISDGELELRVKDQSGSATRRAAWPEGAVLTDGADLLLRRAGLVDGARFSYAKFSTTTLSFDTVTITIGPKETVDLLDGQATLTRAHVVDSAMTIVGYYDADFRVIKGTAEMFGKSFVMFACDEQAALASSKPLDLLEIGTVACPARLDSHTRARPLTYRLQPKGADRPDIPSDDRQSVAVAEDGSVLVTIAPIVQPIGRRLGYSGDDQVALEALAPARYVQSNDERIAALARKVIGDVDDALAAARRLEAFVHTYVEPTMEKLSFDSAATVYETRSGDCTEHAVLLAAMCRAVGIPAQVVNGLAYVDAGEDETPRFISHAWVRVFIGERWTHLDATSRYVDGGYIMLSAGSGDDEDRLKDAQTFGLFDIVQVITPDAVYGSADAPGEP